MASELVGDFDGDRMSRKEWAEVTSRVLTFLG